MPRDATPTSLPLPAIEAIADPAVDELPLRQCGRCRRMFEGDPALDVRARNEWCLCPACEASLLPNRAGRSNVVALRRRSAGRDEG